MDRKDFIQAIKPVQDIQNETGRKIRRLRMHRQIPAKVLGKPYHISEASMLQYELGIRSVSEEKLRNIANALGTRPSVLRPRHLAGIEDAMQVLFEIAELFELEPSLQDGRVVLSAPFSDLDKYLKEWAKQFQKYKDGELTEEQYQEWKDYFPFSLLRFPEPYGPNMSGIGMWVEYDRLDESIGYPYNVQDDPVLHKHEDRKHFDVPSSEFVSVDFTATSDSDPTESNNDDTDSL